MFVYSIFIQNYINPSFPILFDTLFKHYIYFLILLIEHIFVHIELEIKTGE